MLIFRHMVEELGEEPRVVLTKIVADMPERHDLKGLVGHQGFHACEYCDLKGVTSDGRGNVYRPYPQCLPKRENLRTHDKMKEMAR